MNLSVPAAPSLKVLLDGLAQVLSGQDRPITGLASDSRQVQAGDLFLATQGLTHHGLEFLPAVRKMGAAAVAWEPPYHGPLEETRELPLVVVDALGRKVGLIAERFFGHPNQYLDLIGVTGTDGKTSCTHFIAEALSKEGSPCGLMGTLGYGVHGQLTPAAHTTPDALTLQRWLTQLHARGVARIAMEVSSHALAQGRVAGLEFAVAVLTNLGRDHLDYHGNPASYAEAKARLFLQHRPHYAVLNLDDAFGRKLAGLLSGQITVVGYGLEDHGATPVDAFVGGRDLRTSAAGLQLQVRSPWGEGTLRANLLGRFNASNLLAALASLLVLEMPLAEALRKLSRASPVSGRMERFGGHDGRPLVVVDYAHTPQSLEQVLRVLRQHCDGKIWCVFGCGGDRDPGKRALMGACAERYADRVVVTDDNPRGEDPRRIVADILAGMERPRAAQRCSDRGSAITGAIAGAARGDVVLIAGKGHEDYQLVGDERIPFRDSDVVRTALGEGA